MSILALDTANVALPRDRNDLPLTHKFTPEPARNFETSMPRHIEFEIRIPIATGGKQKWFYSANGFVLGHIVKNNDPYAKQQYCVFPLEGAKRGFRFSTFAKAEQFIKGLA